MYFLAYAANDTHRNCIGVATSATAIGPYKGESTPIVCDGDGGTAMDPRSYDHDDGTVWLFYGSHQSPIMVVQLSASRLSVADGATPQVALRADQSTYGRLVEGPWVYKVSL